MQVVLPAAGQNVKSAYQIWLDQGDIGTEADFLSKPGGSIASGTVTSALGYTPYDAANPSSYVTQTAARAAISASGWLTYNSTTGIVTLPNNAVTNAKLTHMAAATFKGKAGATAAAPSDMSASTVRSLLAVNLVENKSSATIRSELTPGIRRSAAEV